MIFYCMIFAKYSELMCELNPLKILKKLAVEIESTVSKALQSCSIFRHKDKLTITLTIRKFSYLPQHSSFSTRPIMWRNSCRLSRHTSAYVVILLASRHRISINMYTAVHKNVPFYI